MAIERLFGFVLSKKKRYEKNRKGRKSGEKGCCKICNFLFFNFFFFLDRVNDMVH